MPGGDGTTEAVPAERPDEADLPVGEASDRELVRRHVAGHPDAFAELFARHRDRMWAVALRTTGNRELASDCVQDAFIAAYRRASSFRGDAAFTTWMHRIVVNACLDRLRRDKPTAELPEYDLPDPRDAHSSAEAGLDVRAALARLPEAQRTALVLVDMHGLPVAEAAQVLGVAEGTVKSRCFRGRAALAEILGDGRGTPGDRAGATGGPGTGAAGPAGAARQAGRDRVPPGTGPPSRSSQST